MHEVFVLVVQQGSANDRMVTYHTKEKALGHIAGVGREPNDPRVIERVFSVNDFGCVTHYQVVFNGKLQLEAIPEQFVRGL